ncbi:MAG: rhombosortase [Burkholderiaceae bacterium]
MRTRRVLVVLALVCTALAILCAMLPHAREWLDYDREALARGEVWRLATAHLVHLSAAHAALDITALLLVGWIFGPYLQTRELVGLLVVAIIVIDASLWCLHPEVDHYAGLSGLLHAWFAACATLWLLSAAPQATRISRRAWGVALLTGLAVKLALESGGHAFWLADAGFHVVTAAHRWGAAAGFACAIVIIVIRRRLFAAPASPRR